MHVLILGGRGQLGRALHACFRGKPHVEVTSWDRPEVDITQPAIAVQLMELQPQVVINAAAWTDVDGAESHPDQVYAVNALGPKYLAEGCARCGALFVQVSTNEVFAGAPGTFYREYDVPAPVGIYARSKLAGEAAARQMLDRLIVVRTAWLFGPEGSHFPGKIVAAADRHGALTVVADEFGNPSYAPDVAAAIERLIELGRTGIYHIVNDGCTSRFEFAAEVLRCSGRSHIPLTPTTLAEWSRVRKPPAHAVLVNQAAAALGITLRPWRTTVAEYFGGRATA